MKIIKQSRATKNGKSAIFKIVLAVFMLSAIVCSAASCGGSASGAGYIVLNEAAFPIYDKESDTTILVYNANRLNDTIEGSYSYGAMSYSGSNTYIISEDDTLYSITAKGADKVADDVEGAVISLGGAIAYIDSMDTLYVYDTASKKSTRISDDVDDEYLVLSPKGKVVLYSSGDELYAWMNGKSNKIANDYVPISSTDDGKCIYVVNRENSGLYITDSTGENKEKIASEIRANCIVNESGTEIIYVSDSKAYLSVKGGEPTKLGNVDNLDVIVPHNVMDSEGYYRPVTTFSNSLLYTWDSSDRCYIVGYVNKDNEYVKIAKDVSLMIPNQSATELYYMKEDVLYKAAASKSFEPEKLADDVVSFNVTIDGKFVYYTNIDLDLYSLDAKGNKNKVATDVYAGDISGNTMYFITDFSKSSGTLYSCSNGKDKVKVDDEVNSVESIGSMITYYKSGDDGEYTIYFSMDGKKFTDVKYSTKSSSGSGDFGNSSGSQSSGSSSAAPSNGPSSASPSSGAR
ncbi:MAG: hypothetical protein HFE63_04405 [Clostridiales bacterium]|nr:hypothetical protein [Clostridiales bacterium]